MRDYILIFGILILLAIGMNTCGNYRTKKFGATTTIQLDKGQKLVNAHWDGGSVWYITEPMEDGYKPQTKVMQEKSMRGFCEGKVIFIECN